MESAKLKTIESFVSQTAEVAILDRPDADQAAFVKRTIAKTAICPDGTHLRIYFDKHYFFAVPLSASIEENDGQWSAYDHDAGLKYVIRKECGIHV